MARLTRAAYEERLRETRLLMLDVDGVFTTGEILYVEDDREGKLFNVRDGSAIYIARLIGVRTAVITARSSRAVARRFAELPVDHVIQGRLDKAAACREILRESGIGASEAAYVGDDLIDLPVLEHVGLGIAVADAHERLLDRVDWVTRRGGGRGAVREVVDDLVTARGIWDEVLDDYRRLQLRPAETAVEENSG